MFLVSFNDFILHLCEDITRRVNTSRSKHNFACFLSACRHVCLNGASFFQKQDLSFFLKPWTTAPLEFAWTQWGAAADWLVSHNWGCVMHKQKWWYKHFKKAHVEKTVNRYFKVRKLTLVCHVSSTTLCWSELQPEYKATSNAEITTLMQESVICFQLYQYKTYLYKVELATGRMQLHLLKAKHNWAEFIICKASVWDGLCLSLHSHNICDSNPLFCLFFCFTKENYKYSKYIKYSNNGLWGPYHPTRLT